ncbi:MAG: glycogen synthase GlgA [Rhodothermales bacterium]
MRICFASSECVPFVKTGGLADVSGALPKALAERGHEVKVFLPLYDKVRVFDHGLVFAEDISNIPVGIGGKTITFNTWYGQLPGSDAEVYLIDCPHYFHRGAVYTNDHDEDERFILFQRAVFSIIQRYNWSPDILHCNDWQTGLMPVYLRETYQWDDLFKRTASVMTIHNIGYQGRFTPGTLHNTGLSNDLFYLGGPLEFEGSLSFLKAGLAYADLITTVSPTYAQEIQTSKYGAGLDGILRARAHDLHGVLNGIDPTDWNPASDAHIPQTYDLEQLDQKEANKRALLKHAGLPYAPNVPVLGIVTRFASQKGLDLLKPILSDLLHHHRFQLVVLGSGEDDTENFFRWATHTYGDRVWAHIGYDIGLSHLIEAGSDMFLMPSHYEPCGLNQMYSLAYGTVPIVRKTGGLADTVHDFHETNGNGNGFSFYDATPYALKTTIERALALYHDKPTWRAIQHRGMSTDFSWGASADAYSRLYDLAKAKR